MIVLIKDTVSSFFYAFNTIEKTTSGWHNTIEKAYFILAKGERDMSRWYELKPLETVEEITNCFSTGTITILEIHNECHETTDGYW